MAQVSCWADQTDCENHADAEKNIELWHKIWAEADSFCWGSLYKNMISDL